MSHLTLGFAIPAVLLIIGLFIWKNRSHSDGIDKVSVDRSGRIDIYSQDKMFELKDVVGGGSTPTRCDYARWEGSTDQQKHWIVEGGVGEKWENIWIEFTAASSGYVLINLRGSFYANMQQYHHDVWVDDCTVDGAPLKNAGFEMIDPRGKPAYWSWGGSIQRYSSDGSQAHSGKCCVLVWHDLPLVQNFAVEANRRYKVSAWFKGCR